MIFNKLNDSLNCKTKLVKAKLVFTEGSVPRNKDTFMFISTSKIFGTIGGGQLEYLIINKARNILKNNKKNYSTKVNIPLGPAIGQCCGGYAQIELIKFENGKDAYNSEKKFYNQSKNDLYIFGAGHIGQEISKRSIDLDFNINLIDSRKEYLDTPKEKDIIKIYAKYPWMLIKNLPKSAYYIILTHSHDYDFKIINELLNFDTFDFIGLIGSKTKRKKFDKRFLDLGHDRLLMNKIECPIGLSAITSKKPGEIAISIIGRLLEFRTNIISTQIENKDLLNSNVK